MRSLKVFALLCIVGTVFSTKTTLKQKLAERSNNLAKVSQVEDAAALGTEVGTNLEANEANEAIGEEGIVQMGLDDLYANGMGCNSCPCDCGPCKLPKEFQPFGCLPCCKCLEQPCCKPCDLPCLPDCECHNITSCSA